MLFKYNFFSLIKHYVYNWNHQRKAPFYVNENTLLGSTILYALYEFLKKIWSGAEFASINE